MSHHRVLTTGKNPRRNISKDVFSNRGHNKMALRIVQLMAHFGEKLKAADATAGGPGDRSPIHWREEFDVWRECLTRDRNA